MTLLQIEYVLACAELGSITRAARRLYTTAPNLSKMIHSLEDELGFEIFRKSNRGIEPTEKGRSFLSHAADISESCRKIEDLNPKKHSNRFSCVCMQIPHCFEAFARLCLLYQAEEAMNFSLSMDYYSVCVDKVIKRNCELGIISMPYLVDAIQRDSLENSGLCVEHLKRQTLNINLRKGHPVLEHYVPGEPFDFTLLQDYPYVSYSSAWARTNGALDFSQQSYFAIGAINPQRTIYVNNMDWKAQLVGLTDAFSIGITGPEELAEKNNWVCIPLPDYQSNMYCIYPRSSQLSPEAQQYIQILREVLDTEPV